MRWVHHDSKEPFWASADSSSGRRDPAFGITKVILGHASYTVTTTYQMLHRRPGRLQSFGGQ